MWNLFKIGIMVFCIFILSSMNTFAEQPNMPVIQAEFQKIDANKDSLLIPGEMQAYQEKRFDELDRDKNGVLDKEELGQDKTKMFEKADKNKDGKITRQESDLQFKEYLNEMDSNKDGKVSEKEYKEYWPMVIKF
ncbi:MAG: hypothetical protein AB1472_07215 [Candidatus Omnitrophota bacterium]